MTDAETTQIATPPPAADKLQVAGARTGPINALENGLGRLRDSMTAGQRWTATFAMALSIAMVGFGAPELVDQSGATVVPVASRQVAAAFPAVPAATSPSVTALTSEPLEDLAPLPDVGATPVEPLGEPEPLPEPEPLAEPSSPPPSEQQPETPPTTKPPACGAVPVTLPACPIAAP